ncbi:terminase small subunit [Lysinibacillus sp. HST-98]|uniref:terminase small subunit n=1 Tax=Lysinibacillus sp. HST-98 TaxID=2800419 RepID=UPI00192756CC|nr:terminase small subunit [Lysinibacillus sp. HST-98]
MEWNVPIKTAEKYGTFRKKENKKTQQSKVIPEAESQVTVQFDIVPSDGLNDKQLLFCMYNVKYFNATKSYQKAYQCDYITANRNAHRLMVIEGIKEEIMRLKQQLVDSVEEILNDETGKPLLP